MKYIIVIVVMLGLALCLFADNPNSFANRKAKQAALVQKRTNLEAAIKQRMTGPVFKDAQVEMRGLVRRNITVNEQGDVISYDLMREVRIYLPEVN